MIRFLYLVIIFSFISCSNIKLTEPTPEPKRESIFGGPLKFSSETGSFGSGGDNVLGLSNSNSNGNLSSLPINELLWRSSLDTLESIQLKNDNFKSLKVLDLACGRGGDLYKFIQTNFNNNILKEKGGIDFILGIDNDSNNIEYYNNRGKSNNARARFLEYKNEFLDENSKDNIPEIYKNNSVYYITGDINNYDGDDDVSIDDIFDSLMDLENLDFKEREK